MKRRIYGVWGSALAAVAAIGFVAAVCVADELQLRNGSKHTGSLVAADENTIVFRLKDRLLTKNRSEVLAIILGESDSGSGEFPPGVSAAAPLKITRCVTFHRITNFKPEEMAGINNAKISANGANIIFSTYAGTYVIKSDGTSLVKLSEKRNDALIDISADGKKVAWYEGPNEGYVANSDGTGRVKMPGGFNVTAIRLAARGEQLFVLTPERGGIFRISSDGSDMRKIVTAADVARLGAADENGNHWRGRPSEIDVSDDGSKIVFHYLWDAYSVTAKGTGLKRLTKDRRNDDVTLSRVRISGDGRRVAWHNENSGQSAVVIEDWGGGNRVTHTGNAPQGWKCAYGSTLQLTRDGSWAAMAWGFRLYSGNGETSWDVADFGLAGDEPKPLHRASVATITAEGKYACLLLDIGPVQQLAVVNLRPKSLHGAPPLGAINVSPPFLLNDGATNATASAQTGADDLQYVGVAAFQNGWRIDAYGWPNVAMRDGGRDGDDKAEDGVFSSNGLRLRTSPKLAAGPLTLRYFAFTRQGHCLAVDVEGLEVREP